MAMVKIDAPGIQVGANPDKTKNFWLREDGSGNLIVSHGNMSDPVNDGFKIDPNGNLIEREFVSADLSWTAGGLLNITHNLLVVPRVVIVEAVALVAIGDLAVGETEFIAALYTQYGSTNVQYGLSLKKPTTTTVQIRVANTGIVVGGSNGQAAAALNTQVALRVRCRP